MLKQVPIHEDAHVGRVAERRHATYRVSGRGPRLVGPGLLDRLARRRPKTSLVEVIGAADQRHYRPATGNEHEGLDDLVHVAADRARSVDGRSRARRELLYGHADP